MSCSMTLATKQNKKTLDIHTQTNLHLYPTTTPSFFQLMQAIASSIGGNSKAIANALAQATATGCGNASAVASVSGALEHVKVRAQGFLVVW